MSVELESAARLAALKSGIEAKTGETYADLTDGVNALIAGFGSGGGGGEDIPDWDDDSPIVASGSGNSANCQWTLTERGTMRWAMVDPSNTTGDNALAGWDTAALSVIPLEYQQVVTRIRQVDIAEGFLEAEITYAANCERIKLPSTLTEAPLFTGASVRVIDIGRYNFTSISDYWCNGNRQLQTVILPATITRIPQRAFADCYSLTNINLDNITVFGNDCFRESFSLAGEIVFSPDLVSIGATAFYRILINSLKFRQGSALPSIANNSFAQCRALTDIYVPWEEGAVENAPWGATNATIHYNTTYDENGDPIE